MITVRSSVNIDAPLDKVFDLMADPAAKAQLNPLVEPIDVGVVGEEKLKLGSICHYRLRYGNAYLDYHGRVTAFEPNHLIESVTDSEAAIQITVETVAENNGTRLTQTERFEPSDQMLEVALPSSMKERILSLSYKIFLWTDVDSAVRLRRQREEQLTLMLTRNLDNWMAAIKQKLESPGD